MAEDPKPPIPFIPPDTNEETRLYWDRLDAKFANMNPAPLAPELPPDRPDLPPAPEPPRESAPAPEPAPDSTAAPARSATSSATPASPPSGLIADAFAALLALEDGQPGARPIRLTTGDGFPSAPAPAAAPEITDAVIEEVVRRVIERLGPDAVRAVVTDVVSEISERLVKEEIDRVRKPHV